MNDTMQDLITNLKENMVKFEVEQKKMKENANNEFRIKITSWSVSLSSGFPLQTSISLNLFNLIYSLIL